MAPFSNSEARCKGCGRRIVWARHAISGKAMPFDAEPHTHGTWDLRQGFAGADAIAVHDPHADPRYVPHHATCPAVDQFRTPRKSQARLEVET
jgi:hypothetical protein